MCEDILPGITALLGVVLGFMIGIGITTWLDRRKSRNTTKAPKNYYIFIAATEDDRIIKIIGPFQNEQRAEKVAAGAGIRLDRENFYIQTRAYDANAPVPKEGETV